MEKSLINTSRGLGVEGECRGREGNAGPLMSDFIWKAWRAKCFGINNCQGQGMTRSTWMGWGAPSVDPEEEKWDDPKHSPAEVSPPLSPALAHPGLRGGRIAVNPGIINAGKTSGGASCSKWGQLWGYSGIYPLGFEMLETPQPPWAS